MERNGHIWNGDTQWNIPGDRRYFVPGQKYVDQIIGINVNSIGHKAARVLVTFLRA